MKFNFKKITSVIAGLAMIGATVGFAMAAFPSPIVKNGIGSDSAIVVGSTASASDMAAAVNLGTVLDGYTTSSIITTYSTGNITISGEGDKYLLEKSSKKLNLGNGFLDVVSSTIDEDQLPTLLASGKYLDDDNDEFDFNQKINLGNLSVSMFEDNDFNEDQPQIGIRIPSGTNILNYTLDFNDQPSMDKLEGTDITLMGKEYYVLSATNSSTTGTLTLLDAQSTIYLKNGESKTITVAGQTYACSIDFIGEDKVKLNINGVPLNSLEEGETQKLSDGAYLSVKSIDVQNYAGGVQLVEFSIGKGKLRISDGQEIQVNENTVDGLIGYVTVSGGKLENVKLKWLADGDMFLAQNSSITMPKFESVKLSWAGFETPKAENIEVKGSGDYITLDSFPLESSSEDIPILYTTDHVNYIGTGKDADNRLVTSANGTIVFDYNIDEMFVASWTDGRDSESYLMKATNFDKDNSVNSVQIEYKKDGSWTKIGGVKSAGDSVSIGNLDLSIDSVDYTAKKVVISGDTDTFNTLYSKEGMLVILPTNVTSSTTYPLQFFEANKDGDVAAGNNINLTLGFNGATTPQTSVTDVVGESTSFIEIGTSDVHRSFVYSPLATEILWDKSGDTNSANFVYHGGESEAKVYLSSPTVSTNFGGGTTTTSSSKVTIVRDTELSSVQNKNLIVVGGSCINTVAATMLGSSTPLCGADFTAKSGAGVGKSLIKVMTSPFNSDKIAILVAGYEAADTTRAMANFQSGNVSTDIGTNIVA